MEEGKRKTRQIQEETMKKEREENYVMILEDGNE